MRKVKTGLEILTARRASELKNARLGLLANQASVGPGYAHAVEMMDDAFPGQLKKLFGPQHGFAGEKQDNMIESGHGAEARTGRPIYSLYAETRRPRPEMFEGLDALLIDLQDVGTRVYTFAQTVFYCMECAAQAGLKVMLLDRPNPIGGVEVEGNILRGDCRSFVGLFPIPMRHGLTMGELALLMADQMEHRPDLEIVLMEGWRRDMYYSDTGLEWVLPSPNMPTPETAWVYPGQVILEGTDVSEGRGTTRPFHLFGAPYMDSHAVREELEARGLKGAAFRTATFEPTFHKFRGQVCGALEIHPLTPGEFKPYLTSLTILEVLLQLYPNDFSWKKPPYEYEYERMPIDLILGDTGIRLELEAGTPAREIEKLWQPELNKFMDERAGCLLY